jgi:hypothetical protein
LTERQGPIDHPQILATHQSNLSDETPELAPAMFCIWRENN